MRSLESRLEALEAKHCTEPVVLIFIIRDVLRDDQCLSGYDDSQGNTLVRRIDGETDEELLDRARVLAKAGQRDGAVIMLQAVHGPVEASCE